MLLVRLARTAFGSKDGFEIREDDEGSFPLDQAFDELRRPFEADARRRLAVRFGKRRDFVDAVGPEADQRRRSVEVEFDHDDAAVDGGRRHRHAHGDTDVGERDHLAAKVDHGVDERPAPRNDRLRQEIEDLAYDGRLEGEGFPADLEGQDLDLIGRCVLDGFGLEG